MSRARKSDGAPHTGLRDDNRAARSRFRVVRADGVVLAGAPTREEAERLASFLGASVEGGRS